MKALPPVQPLRSVVKNHIKDDLWPLPSRDDIFQQKQVCLCINTQNSMERKELCGAETCKYLSATYVSIYLWVCLAQEIWRESLKRWGNLICENDVILSILLQGNPCGLTVNSCHQIIRPVDFYFLASIPTTYLQPHSFHQ